MYSSCQQSLNILGQHMMDKSTTDPSEALALPGTFPSSAAATMAMLRSGNLGILLQLDLPYLHQLNMALIFVRLIARHCSPLTPEQQCLLLPSRAIRSISSLWMIPPKFKHGGPWFHIQPAPKPLVTYNHSLPYSSMHICFPQWLVASVF